MSNATVPANGEAMSSNRRRSKTKARPYHPLDDLPFTVAHPGSRRCFWNVAPTGDYTKDCFTGSAYALQYLEYELGCDGPGCLPSIVEDMPRDLSGIEVGFLATVLSATKRGIKGARRINEYHLRCMGEME